jgi:hypothetical protein
MQTRFEDVQAFQEGEHHQAYTQRSLLPILSRYTKTLGKGGGIKQVAHDAFSSCLMSSSLPQNGGRVSRKVLEWGHPYATDPVIRYTLTARRHDDFDSILGSEHNVLTYVWTLCI